MRREESSARIPNTPRLLLAFMVVALTALLGFLALASPVLATEAHIFSFRFGREVNETAVKEHAESKPVTEEEENICTASSGASCKGGAGGSAPGDLAAPRYIAINETSGNIYVTDEGNRRVDVFSSSGAFLFMFGKEVNATTKANVCTAAEVEAGNICQPGHSSAGSGGFIEPSGIAVANASGATSGDVYVAEVRSGLIEVFSETGSFLQQFNGEESPRGELTEPGGLAVDAQGNVYAANRGIGEIDEFSYESAEQRYEYVSRISFGQRTAGATAVAVDPSRDVYVRNETGEVSEYNPTHQFVRTLVATGSWGVAVDEHTTDVYISPEGPGPIKEYGPAGEAILEFGAIITGGDNDVAVGPASEVYDVEESNDDVDKFVTSSQVPGVEAMSATNVQETRATLNGGLEPYGFPTTYFFEYGTSEQFGGVAPAVPAQAANSVAAVSETITGLTPGTKYYYRLVGEAGYGSQYSATETFTTLVLAPDVTPTVVANIGHESAILETSINPEGASTSYRVVFAPCAAARLLGTSFCKAQPAAEGTIPAGMAPVTVVAALTGLSPNTKYAFALLATNGRETAGVPGEFVTDPLPPGTITLSPGEVTSDQATIYGAVNPEGSATEYEFEYGVTSSYGEHGPTLAGSAGSGSEYIDVTGAITGLAAGTTYHYRLVATNNKGGTPQTTYGEDETFTTAVPFGYPSIPTGNTGPASAVTQYGATLSGSVVNGEVGTTALFEYGPTEYYGAAAAATGSTSVSAAISGLQPGTTYHYRLVVTGPGGTAYGEDKPFTTPPAPLATPAPGPPLPTVTPPTKTTTTKSLTKTQKLTKALNACRTRYKAKSKKSKRTKCEKQASKKYGPLHKTKKKAKKSSNRNGKAGR